MGDAATTTLSSKGQVVIPEEIRSRLGLKPGAQFVVVADRDVVILKVLDPPKLREFAALAAQARRIAKQTGLRQSDVAQAVAKVRRSR
jgi:AbrB family looped-hinge helix DNA binding protein